MGANTATMPSDQARDWSTAVEVGPPIIRARTALTVMVTGWRSAHAWSQPGIDARGTKADEANTSGTVSGKVAAWALSALRTPRPTMANSHDRAKPSSSRRATPARKASTVVDGRNPTR